ncbi:energy-coupling factor ABC transporter ATP-binding protein [bacterium]|nr:energy-coupling factor ABC transporter ATP-binding protein [bacterium]
MDSHKTLRIRNLAYSFKDGGTLLSSISLEIKAGETVVVFGGNGSGKSTLLRCIAGLLPFAEGEVTIGEKSGDTLRSHIGLVMQNPEHQMIAPTVEEEIALGLEFRGMERNEMLQRVEQVLNKYSLQELRERAPDTLSGGQMQRVALAAIAALEPEFLLFDEPDSLLDAPSRRDFLNAVSLLGQGIGMLWACADADRLPRADRHYRLAKGEAREVTVEQILQAD